jgi:hypothetical protein
MKKKVKAKQGIIFQKKTSRREGLFIVDDFIKDGGRTGVSRRHCHDMPR